jgi:serine/threonine protein kinase
LWKILAQFILGLITLDSSGHIHGDIRIENLIVDEDNNIKIGLIFIKFFNFSCRWIWGV